VKKVTFVKQIKENGTIPLFMASIMLNGSGPFKGNEAKRKLKRRSDIFRPVFEPGCYISVDKARYQFRWWHHFVQVVGSKPTI